VSLWRALPSFSHFIRATDADPSKIPKPAGAGGGSSLSSFALFSDLARPGLESTLDLRRESGGDLRRESGGHSGAVSWVASLSSDTSARRIASNSTTAPLSSRRNAGAFSTARASEIQDARTALFSVVVSSGSLTTSSGCV
jgi:hypothetical protein